MYLLLRLVNHDAVLNFQLIIPSQKSDKSNVQVKISLESNAIQGTVEVSLVLLSVESEVLIPNRDPYTLKSRRALIQSIPS